MLGWAARTVVALVLGLTASLLVAWSAAIAATARSDQIDDFVYNAGPLSYWCRVFRENLCHSEVLCGDYSPVGQLRPAKPPPLRTTLPIGTRLPDKPDLVTCTHRFGFPLPCVWGGDDTLSSGCFISGAGNPATVALWHSGSSWTPLGNSDRVLLPIGVLPGGLALNSALYGLPFFGLFNIGAFRRASRRRRRGHCPRCGYDLRHDLASGCPECGWNRQSAAVGA